MNNRKLVLEQRRTSMLESLNLPSKEALIEKQDHIKKMIHSLEVTEKLKRLEEEETNEKYRTQKEYADAIHVEGKLKRELEETTNKKLEEKDYWLICLISTINCVLKYLTK